MSISLIIKSGYSEEPYQTYKKLLNTNINKCVAASRLTLSNKHLIKK